jgi:hypothetical protein
MGVFMMKKLQTGRRNRIGKGNQTGVVRLMRTGLLLLAIVFTVAVIPGLLLAGCSMMNTNSNKVSELDYTVVKDQDLPTELKKLIEEKKANTLRLTYTTKDYTYLVAGYGTQQSSGYSIRVNDVYLGTNAIYADVSLIGPAAGESVTETPTTPYIVLKIEKRDESVVFNM